MLAVQHAEVPHYVVAASQRTSVNVLRGAAGCVLHSQQLCAHLFRPVCRLGAKQGQKGLASAWTDPGLEYPPLWMSKEVALHVRST